MPPRNLNIGDWQPPPPIRVPVRTAKYRLPDFRVVGLLGTLALHALVFQSFLMGSRAHKVRPEAQGLGATSLKSEAPPSETLILIAVPTASINDKALAEDLASLGPKNSETLVTLLSPDPLPHLDIPQDQQSTDENSKAAIESGDSMIRAAQFGLYTGQIDARIERAWRRPRSPVSLMSGTTVPPNISSIDELFKCQVRIIQDEHGAIQEIQLLICNGSSAWQHSLITAILATSPLPAPPDPNVFTKSITMQFSGQSFTPTSSTEDYEPALHRLPDVRNVAQDSAIATRNAFVQSTTAEPIRSAVK